MNCLALFVYASVAFAVLKTDPLSSQDLLPRPDLADLEAHIGDIAPFTLERQEEKQLKRRAKQFIASVVHELDEVCGTYLSRSILYWLHKCGRIAEVLNRGLMPSTLVMAFVQHAIHNSGLMYRDCISIDVMVVSDSIRRYSFIDCLPIERLHAYYVVTNRYTILPSSYTVTTAEGDRILFRGYLYNALWLDLHGDDVLVFDRYIGTIYTV